MTQNQTPPRNLLASENSPYLLQHKDNPIAWFPWGERAFAAAKAENKPIFLSVGYSTCHWCHVMAHESFADQEVADALNAGYVSIKVDREERPDVDDVYMRALQALSGGGGWPMSVWLTPEGKPFFAGTYFPKYRLLQLLRRIDELWRESPESLFADGEKLLGAVDANRREDLDDEDSAHADWEKALGVFINHFQYHFDERHGGFGGAPKFPPAMSLMTMMRRDRLSGMNQAEVMVTTTLRTMARGGIFDHLRGGFHRYSVDDKWLVPHFEKMLYDQALIGQALTEAALVYNDPELARAARETLDYVLREMTHPEGGFYSGQDADSLDPKTGHFEEGHFATFAFNELKETLSAEELEAISRAFGVTPQGNFEGRSVLSLQEGVEVAVKDEPMVRSALEKLEQVRAARPAPHLDDKIIGGWNGWMIAAFARAARAFGEERYLTAARRALGFARDHLWKDGALARFWREGHAKGRATAEDYTSLIHACLETHQADLDPRWAELALRLQSALDRDFWDGEDGGHFLNDGGDPHLPLRPKDDYDGVSPSANAMGAFNLSRLFLLSGDASLKHRAERIFRLLFNRFRRHPSGLPFFALALDFHLAEPKVAVVAGAGWPRDAHREAGRRFDPYVLWTAADAPWAIAQGKPESSAAIYVCEEGRCFAPARNVEEARAQLTR